MIIRLNESKLLLEHISCTCKYRLDSKKCNLNQKWNKENCGCEYT